MTSVTFLLMRFSVCILVIFFSGTLRASEIEILYAKNCAGCHGKKLNGGSASSLVDGYWEFGASKAQIARNIKVGLIKEGMPAWQDAFDDRQIEQLVDFIAEQTRRVTIGVPTQSASKKGSHSLLGHTFELENLASFEGTPWAIAFLPDGDLLITERGGTLWRYKNKKLVEIKNPPEVWAHGQGGLLDVQVHPQFQSNGWIYLAHSEGSLLKGGMTKIIRGKVENDAWVKEETIYSIDSDYHSNRRVHFGSRIVLDDGYVYFSVGDRGARDQAQDLSRPNGKIHRLHDDGRIPKDNPFVGEAKALSTIWSYGHRNPQGLTLNPKTGQIWSTEHGPKGGDELNVIEKGKNYGWPVITYGINYSGTIITSETHREGMEQPKHYWIPSIATSGIDFYYGDIFPEWTGKLFVSGMVTESLHLMSIHGDKVTAENIVFENLGRVRDVAVSPDGQVYVLLNTRSSGVLYRLKSI